MTLPPAWIRRFRAARVRLPFWALDAPERAAYATNASGVWQLTSWDLGSGVHTALTAKPTGVVGGAVLPDGTGVTWFDDHAGDEVGRWLVAPFAGGEPAPLVPDAGEGWGAGLALRNGRLAVGVADRDGFRIRSGTRDETLQVYASDKPAEVGGLSGDGALLAVGHAEHGDLLHPSLYVLDAWSGERVAALADGEGNGVHAAGWSPVPGDPRLAILADRSGRTRPELWTPATGERVPLAMDLPGEVWVADWEPDGGALVLAHDYLGRTSLYRYDLAAAAMLPLDLAAGTVTAAAVRPDGALWYAFSSSSAPSQVRVRSSVTAGPEADAMLLEAPGERAPTGRSYQARHVDNGEGGRVHAFLAVPEGEGPHPLVVEVHGGPSAQTEDTFDPYVQAWVDHGFAVLLPNYRGSTGYGKSWQDAVAGDPGRPELVDVRACRDALVADGTADAERVVLSGASWGGYLTLLGLGTQPESWSAGVAGVPVADYPAAFQQESPELQDFDITLFGGTPEQLPDLYRERSPLTHVGRVQAPVLIITGRNDTRCPLPQVENYVAALLDAGGTVTLDVFDAGHGSLAVEEAIREQGLALDFAAGHLGTRPADR